MNILENIIVLATNHYNVLLVIEYNPMFRTHNLSPDSKLSG